jgi:hypothetical protein
LNAKKAAEKSRAIFLKSLIEAQGEYVKTKELGTIIAGVDGTGEQGSNVPGIFSRLPSEAKGYIQADSTKRSLGYKIKAPEG